MASACVILCCLAILPWQVAAQVITEETVVTDTVDLRQPRDAAATSAGIAMAGTILLPGLGHQYLARQDRAFAYFSAEALFVVGAICCEQYSRRVFENSQSYAWVYAMAAGGPGADEQYWQRVGQYLDSRKYNEDQELNRTPESKYVAENLQWRWADESFMKTYQAMRRDASAFRVASSFFLGAMVLNRVVSFIDVRAATRDRGIRRNTGVSVTPMFSADLSSAGLLVCGAF